MRKNAMFMSAMAAAFLLGSPGTIAVPSDTVEARPLAAKPQPVAPQKADDSRLREQRIRSRLRRVKMLTAHKTRSPGERAHRRWRKTRSAGRR